jgi:hypothetical protein
MSNLKVKDGSGLEKYIEYIGSGTDVDPLLGKTIPKLLNPDGTYSEKTNQTLIFSTNALLTNGQTYDSTVLSLGGYTQVQTDILSNKNGTITIDFIRDAAGTDILRTLTIPYLGGSGFKMFSAPAFTPYVQYKFTCDETGQTDFYFDTKAMTGSLSGQVLGLDDFISTSMVANLGRNLIVGQDSSGSFENVSITNTTNDAGTYRNLNVVNGARPSELAGRTKVAEVVDTTVSVLQRTITASKTFFVTDLILTIDNTDATTTGRVNLRDGLTVAGTVVLPMLIAESPASESVVTVITHHFSEPIQFTTGLFIEEGAGTNEITGTLIGYEE